jgi:hypothetical protein
MTTIRAHIPVETPAGLMVALPPCDGSYGCSTAVHIDGCYASRYPNTPPDVFDLAVPCRNCLRDMPGYILSGGNEWKLPDGRFVWRCDCQDGWVHHGDYRVLDVLPIVGPHFQRTEVTRYLFVSLRKILLRNRTAGTVTSIDLPAAVPGGVALIVEPV